MCLSSCPTYRITGQEMSSPRGRLWLMNAVAEGRLELNDPVFEEQMYQCLNCRACEAVCPSGVHYGPLVEASRAQIEQHQDGRSGSASLAESDARLDLRRRRGTCGWRSAR